MIEGTSELFGSSTSLVALLDSTELLGIVDFSSFEVVVNDLCSLD